MRLLGSDIGLWLRGVVCAILARVCVWLLQGPLVGHGQAYRIGLVAAVTVLSLVIIWFGQRTSEGQRASAPAFAVFSAWFGTWYVIAIWWWNSKWVIVALLVFLCPLLILPRIGRRAGCIPDGQER